MFFIMSKRTAEQGNKLSNSIKSFKYPSYDDLKK